MSEGGELVPVTAERMAEMLRENAEEFPRVESGELERVIEELSIIGFSDITDYLDAGVVFDAETGEPVTDQSSQLQIADVRALPRRQTAAIKKLKLKKTRDGGTEVELELHDKLGALDKLAKGYGFFDKHERAKGEGAAEATLNFLLAAAGEQGAEMFQPTPEPEEVPR